MRKILLYLALKYNGNYQDIYHAISAKEKVDPSLLDGIEEKIKCNYITIIDNNYPSTLKRIGTPPIVLFYYGNIELLEKINTIAVIGNRDCSNYGEQMTRKIVQGLKEYDPVIVSGGARGVDAIAHETALNNNMSTILVSACGIDAIYPPSSEEIYQKVKEKGLLISEYPNDLIPEHHYFLIRNRIIAALAETIVVTEAKYRSGTMNTVAYGLEFGKDICCVPANANTESGCNHLIKQGARLIEKAKDIYE